MLKIRCVVEHITYQNAENGYSIMKVNVKGYKDLVTLVGSLLDVPVGSVLLCDGDWKVDKKYGSQFVVQSWEEVMPATIYGIEKYLGSGLVKGIGPKFAKLIVSKFGLETIDVIETDIERLHEVAGIGKVRVEKIRESWEKQKDIKNVMLFLQGYGVSTAYAAKIYRQYGKESIEKVKGNPYRLADDIWASVFIRRLMALRIRWVTKRTIFAVVVVDCFIRSTNSATRSCVCRGRTVGQGCHYLARS
jgi:exodeoxyribonuclease V alpha subunit